EDAIRRVASGPPAVLLFTSATQVDHVAQVAREMGEWERFQAAALQALVASIGPICSEALREHGLPVHLEPEHPRMGHLVRAAAEALSVNDSDLTPETQRHGELEDSKNASSVSLCLWGESPSDTPPKWLDSPFMRACRREEVPYTPVWLMRQAGRYMKEYRELRERVSFLDLCKSPELVSEVTVSA